MSKSGEIIKGLIKGLNFLSETDDVWTLFLPYARRTGPVTSKSMAELTGLEFYSCVDFADFFNHAIKTQSQSRQYAELYEGLVELLGQRKVFKMLNSPNNYEYYVVGIDFENNLVGCHVTSVET